MECFLSYATPRIRLVSALCQHLLSRLVGTLRALARLQCVRCSLLSRGRHARGEAFCCSSQTKRESTYSSCSVFPKTAVLLSRSSFFLDGQLAKRFVLFCRRARGDRCLPVAARTLSWNELALPAVRECLSLARSVAPRGQPSLA